MTFIYTLIYKKYFFWKKSFCCCYNFSMIRTSPDTGAGGDSAFPTVDDFNEVNPAEIKPKHACILNDTSAITCLDKVDEMVLEYLLFRGFTRSFRAVAADCKADRIRCFEADMVCVS